MSDRQGTRQEPESVSAFRAAATRFCEAVEGHPSQTEFQFLREMSLLLPTLYAASAHLHAEFPDDDTDQPESQDSDGFGPWSGLFDTLEPFLAVSDRYRKVLWAYPDDDQKDKTDEGCLAADIAFLYAYLKPTISHGPSGPSAGATIRAWSEFIWLKGGDLTRALTAVHDALHDSDLFNDKDP